LDKKLVIIPTYNEKENVTNIIQAVIGLESNFHVLIVDDNSPDGTGQIVDKLISEYKGSLYILHRKEKNGLGPAYIAGFKYGLANNYDYIFEMDADFSHNPKDLLRLFAACKDEGADMSVGSRYTKGGAIDDSWGWYRHMLSFGASLYVRMITFMPVKDPTAGFICYSKKVLDKIDLDNISFTGYAFQIEMKYAAFRNGFRIQEVPITFIDRELGVSKMNTSIVKDAILGVLRMRMKKNF
jgi:dolichol-phosphate mannosyltransferase